MYSNLHILLSYTAISQARESPEHTLDTTYDFTIFCLYYTRCLGQSRTQSQAPKNANLYYAYDLISSAFTFM